MTGSDVSLTIYGGCVALAFGCAIIGFCIDVFAETKWVGFVTGGNLLIFGSLGWVYFVCVSDPHLHNSGWWQIVGIMYALMSLMFSVPAFLLLSAIGFAFRAAINRAFPAA